MHIIIQYLFGFGNLLYEGTLLPGGTFFPRYECPGGHLYLGTNVQGDTFSRGTAIPPTPVYTGISMPFMTSYI